MSETNDSCRAQVRAPLAVGPSRQTPLPFCHTTAPLVGCFALSFRSILAMTLPLCPRLAYLTHHLVLAVVLVLVLVEVLVVVAVMVVLLVVDLPVAAAAACHFVTCSTICLRHSLAFACLPTSKRASGRARQR